MGQECLLWSEVYPSHSLPESHLQFCFSFEVERKEGMSEGIGAFNTVHGSEFLKGVTLPRCLKMKCSSQLSVAHIQELQ